MEISSIFPSSDNLYKFLFMGGIFMIAFSFIYPLEKQQKIELEINLYNKQIELLNEEIASLNKGVTKLKIQTEETLKTLEKQKQEKNEIVAKQKIKEIKDNYNKEFVETKAKETEVITKNIILKYEKDKIELLEEHINSFCFFRYTFLLLGVIFTVFGLRNWYKTAKVLQKLQDLELKKKLKESE